MNKSLYLVDGSAIAYRSHFAFVRSPLITSDGRHTSAVFGFCLTMLSILRKHAPDYIAVVFDSREPTFRHKMFPEYKATREKMPDELVEQMPVIKELVEAMNVRIYEKPGFEADDIIGTYARTGEKQGLDVFLISGDKDFMQLLDGSIRMLNIKASAAGDENLVDPDAVRAKFNVSPEQIIDLLALMGDSSDNVPGVKGVGPKTAAELIAEFGSLDAIYAAPDRIKRESVRRKIEAGRESAMLSKKLVTIDTAVPELDPVDTLERRDWDRAALAAFFKNLEFFKLIRDLDLETEAASAPAPEKSGGEQNYMLADSAPKVRELADTLKRAGSFVVDTETTGLDTRTVRIVGMSFAVEEGSAWYVPVFSRCGADGQGELFDTGQEEVSNKEFLTILRPVLEDENIKKTGQNIKYDLEVFRTNGINLKGIDFDTMLASHILDGEATAHNLDALSLRHLKYRKIPTSALIGKGKNQITMDLVPVEDLCNYACEDADMTLRLSNLFRPRILADSGRRLFENVEVPLISVLADMEMEGIALDSGLLSDMATDASAKLEDIRARVFDLCGREFNVLSPQQVGEVLFESLSIQNQFPGVKVKKKDGSYPTDVRVLEKFRSHPAVEAIIEYRQVSKLLSTYIEALPRMVNPKTGRVHTSFRQTGTATGRLSSNDPNLQNIPIRTEMGRAIRRAFTASAPDRTLFAADYSQIELRVLAHFSEDPALIEAYRTDADIHALTASRIFGLPLERVTGEMRGKAKTINFGIIYGMGPRKLSDELGITIADAKNFIEVYFRIYPGVKAWIERTLEDFRETGAVTTMLGRRRVLVRKGGKNPAALENTAVNTPIQGTAAEIIKLAMLEVARAIKERGLKSRMLLQVHDELVFDAPAAELDELRELVTREMEGALALRVPLKVNTGAGRNWMDAHP